jgi:hypothetical protein
MDKLKDNHFKKYGHTILDYKIKLGRSNEFCSKTFEITDNYKYNSLDNELLYSLRDEILRLAYDMDLFLDFDINNFNDGKLGIKINKLIDYTCKFNIYEKKLDSICKINCLEEITRYRWVTLEH